ncbi:MAG: hypothetical protein R3D29_13925 [Nitratireductor sp.]
MSKSATSFVFLVVLAATITAAFSVYAANAGNTHAQAGQAALMPPFGHTPSCAEQVWPAPMPSAWSLLTVARYISRCATRFDFQILNRQYPS